MNELTTYDFGGLANESVDIQLANEEIYVSNIVTDQDLNKIQEGQFNILRAPRGSGKTTFMFDERILQFARKKKNVLYLVHNKMTRDTIAQNHSDKARVFTSDNAAEGWFLHRQKKYWTSEQDENFVHVMCYQTFASLLRKHGIDWLNDIDLIVWDEFDDIKGYYEKEVKQLKKLLPDFSEEKLIALLQDGQPRSVVNFVYQIKSIVLEPKKIKLLAISATPECAAMYFRDYVNYIIDGRIENKFDALETIFVDSIVNYINQGKLKPKNDKRIWCYTKYISNELRIEAAAKAQGFNVISLWSDTNHNYDHLYDYSKDEARALIKDKGLVPDQYNFVITNGIIGRGIDVYDIRYRIWMCDSDSYEDIGQFERARFRPDLEILPESARGKVEFIQNGFPVDYYDWKDTKEFKQLLQDKPIFTAEANPKRILTTSALKNAYPDRYESRRKGRGGTTQHRIKPAA